MTCTFLGVDMSVTNSDDLLNVDRSITSVDVSITNNDVSNSIQTTSSVLNENSEEENHVQKGTKGKENLNSLVRYELF